MTAEHVLMVGDRAAPDGRAVEHGITTLLLPPLLSPQRHPVVDLPGRVPALGGDDRVRQRQLPGVVVLASCMEPGGGEQGS